MDERRGREGTPSDYRLLSESERHAAALKKARSAIENSQPKLDRRFEGLIPKATLLADAQRVKRVKERIQQEDDNNIFKIRQKERARILEAIIGDQLELASWLGLAETSYCSDFDDLFNGIDIAINLKDESESLQMLFGLDITYSENELNNKLQRWIQRNANGGAGKINYLDLPESNLQGAYETVPVFILSFNEKEITRLRNLWMERKSRDLDYDSVKWAILEQILFQIHVYRAVAQQNNHELLVDRYNQLEKALGKTVYQATLNNDAIKYLERFGNLDSMFSLIKEHLPTSIAKDIIKQKSNGFVLSLLKKEELAESSMATPIIEADSLDALPSERAAAEIAEELSNELQIEIPIHRIRQLIDRLDVQGNIRRSRIPTRLKATHYNVQEIERIKHEYRTLIQTPDASPTDLTKETLINILKKELGLTEPQAIEAISWANEYLKESIVTRRSPNTGTRGTYYEKSIVNDIKDYLEKKEVVIPKDWKDIDDFVKQFNVSRRAILLSLRDVITDNNPDVFRKKGLHFFFNPSAPEVQRVIESLNRKHALREKVKTGDVVYMTDYINSRKVDYPYISRHLVTRLLNDARDETLYIKGPDTKKIILTEQGIDYIDQLLEQHRIPGHWVSLDDAIKTIGITRQNLSIWLDTLPNKEQFIRIDISNKKFIHPNIVHFFAKKHQKEQTVSSEKYTTTAQEFADQEGISLINAQRALQGINLWRPDAIAVIKESGRRKYLYSKDFLASVKDIINYKPKPDNENSQIPNTWMKAPEIADALRIGKAEIYTALRAIKASGNPTYIRTKYNGERELGDFYAPQIMECLKRQLQMKSKTPAGKEPSEVWSKESYALYIVLPHEINDLKGAIRNAMKKYGAEGINDIISFEQLSNIINQLPQNPTSPAILMQSDYGTLQELLKNAGN